MIEINEDLKKGEKNFKKMGSKGKKKVKKLHKILNIIERVVFIVFIVIFVIWIYNLHKENILMKKEVSLMRMELIRSNHYYDLKTVAYKFILTKWKEAGKKNIDSILAWNIADYIVKYSLEYKVPIYIVLACFYRESNFNNNVISNKGALGIAQIMPHTAYLLLYALGKQHLLLTNKDVKNILLGNENIELNIQLGVYFLKLLYDSYGDWEEVLDFYYGGRYFLGKKKVSDYSKFVLSLSKKILENSFVLKELYKER